MEKMQELFEKFESVTDKANVDAVFGKPEKVGERTLIPVAEVAYGWGMGMGEAPHVAVDVEMESECECEGDCDCESEKAKGGGGGAGAKVRPLAYIEVGPEGAKVEAIIDEQKVALAGILLTAWIMGWVGLLIKTFSKKS
jgi:uncharacterized spore protein YtfJ